MARAIVDPREADDDYLAKFASIDRLHGDRADSAPACHREHAKRIIFHALGLLSDQSAEGCKPQYHARHMSEQELVVIRQFNNRIVAEVARSVLKSARIMSFIKGDDPGIRAPVFLPVRIELVVRASDAGEADTILGPELTR